MLSHFSCGFRDPRPILVLHVRFSYMCALVVPRGRSLLLCPFYMFRVRFSHYARAGFTERDHVGLPSGVRKVQPHHFRRPEYCKSSARLGCQKAFQVRELGERSSFPGIAWGLPGEPECQVNSVHFSDMRFGRSGELPGFSWPVGGAGREGPENGVATQAEPGVQHRYAIASTLKVGSSRRSGKCTLA